MTVGTHPVTPRSPGRAITVLQDNFSPAKELAATEMSLEEKTRKRARWTTKVLKTCNRCAACEAFIMKLDAMQWFALVGNTWLVTCVVGNMRETLMNFYFHMQTFCIWK